MSLTGDEPFLGVPATVADFWRFSMGNLRTNNVRGYLAEFLVAQAVGSSSGRIEWDDHDVVTASGFTVEVKSGGYVQAWERTSGLEPVITFSGLRGRAWDEVAGRRDTEVGYKAQVFVFCVATARTVQDYRPLDVSQWEFFVLPRAAVAATGQNSMRLTTVRRLAGTSHEFAGLREAIDLAVAADYDD